MRLKPVQTYTDVSLKGRVPGELHAALTAYTSYYCETSGWFESADGVSKFDRHGFYREGPALRGLDRVAVRQEHGFVSVDPSQRAPGPPPTVTDGGQPLGQYCSGPNPSSVDPKTGRWVVPVVSGEQTTG